MTKTNFKKIIIIRKRKGSNNTNNTTPFGRTISNDFPEWLQALTDSWSKKASCIIGSSYKEQRIIFK